MADRHAPHPSLSRCVEACGLVEPELFGSGGVATSGYGADGVFLSFLVTLIGAHSLFHLGEVFGLLLETRCQLHPCACLHAVDNGEVGQGLVLAAEVGEVFLSLVEVAEDEAVHGLEGCARVVLGVVESCCLSDDGHGESIDGVALGIVVERGYACLLVLEHASHVEVGEGAVGEGASEILFGCFGHCLRVDDSYEVIDACYELIIIFICVVGRVASLLTAFHRVPVTVGGIVDRHVGELHVSEMHLAGVAPVVGIIIGGFVHSP